MSTMLVTGAVLALAATTGPCCQDAGLFEVPKKVMPQVAPPEGCKAADDRAASIRTEVELELDDVHKQAIRTAVADKDKDETVAEAWSSAGDVAFLNLHVPAALWAELNSLQAEWSSDAMVQAGVYLALMNHDDDAKLMLHCAYDADNRSPYLLEALANIYNRTGDKTNAVRYIGEAQQAAPDDTLINLQKQSFNTGRPPSRPTLPADKVDASMVELKSHINKFLAIIKRGEVLRQKVDVIYSGHEGDDPQAIVDDYRAGFDQTIASMDEAKRLAKLTPAQFKQEFPYNDDSLRIQYRNIYFYGVICAYISVSDNVLQGPREASPSENFNVGFWSMPMGIEPVRYTRMIAALRDFEFEGIKSGVSGYRWDDWGGARFLVFFNYAGDQRRKQGDACGVAHRNDFEAEKACRLEVDKKYCATVRQLHKEWMDETEGLMQKLGRRFDGAATRVLADAGEVVADAYEYAAKYAKEMKVAPTDAQGQDMLKDLNKRYHDVVAKAVGDGDGGPAALVRHEEETYQIYKQNAEAAIAGYKNWIEELCQPVDQRALEALLEEQRNAMRQMLFDRLMRDLNVRWDPNADCTFSMGKWISVKIDVDGNVDVKGKWSPLKKAFEGSPTFEATDKFKFDIKDARYVTASAGLDKSKNYGPFTGKGTINVGIQYDSQTGQTSYPVKLEGKLGFGHKVKYKGQDFGVQCFPGSLKANFDARVVAKDVMDLYNAL